MNLEVVWTGAMETAAIKAQQQPAPPKVLVVKPYHASKHAEHTRAVADFLAVTPKPNGWLLKDLVDAIVRVPRKAVGYALCTLCERGQVRRVYARARPGRPQRYRWQGQA